MKAQLEARMKALAGALITAIVSYAALAFQQGTALTLHGLEAAAVGAVVGFLGVHQAPRNREPKRKAADAGFAADGVVITLAALVVIACGIVYLVKHIH